MNKLTSLPQNHIFVYGANEAGIHGKGAAKDAIDYFGAKNGVIGFYGQSYGIPTKDKELKTLSIEAIKKHVKTFVDFAVENPQFTFILTPIGCGLAGYKPKDIAILFFTQMLLKGKENYPSNIRLPFSFSLVIFILFGYKTNQ